MQSKTMHEPFVRVVKRGEMPMKKKVFVRLAAVALALVADALFIFFVTGLNPIDVYKAMIQGTFSTSMRFSWAMRDLASPADRHRALQPSKCVSEHGREAGSDGGVGHRRRDGLLRRKSPECACSSDARRPLFWPARWGFIPAWFKARFSTNETLFTLMMNYVGSNCRLLRQHLARVSFQLQVEHEIQGRLVPADRGQRYTINLIVVVALTIIMYCYLRCLNRGYEISVVGESENTARYAGINVGKVIIRTMILSGRCAANGLLIVGGRSGDFHRHSGWNGFTAIIVAWLAKINTFTMALISFLLIFLESGGEIASA
ncbi:MAG: ABC transporter permease subunit [Christensenellales bacterium]